MRRIKKIDFYKKYTNEDRIPTFFGACMSLLTIIIILIFFGFELSKYLTPHVSHNVGLIQFPADIIARKKQNEVPLNFDIVFDHLPCALVIMTLQNNFGTQLIDVTNTPSIIVERLSSTHRTLASDYISSSIKEKHSGTNEAQQLLLTQLLEREGCRLKGHFMVDKAPGSLHFFIDIRHYNLIESIFGDGDIPPLTFAHKVKHVSFGDPKDQAVMVKLFGKNSETDFDKAYSIPPQADVNFCLYFFPLVPHMFSIGKERVNKETYQYSVTYNCQKDPIQNAAYQLSLVYSLKPVGIHYSKEEYTFLQILTSLTAIIAGVYVIMGLIKTTLDNFI